MSIPIGRDELDVDALVNSYTQTKRKTISLFLGGFLLFVGSAGGFISLQVANAKVDRSASTAVEMAQLAQKTGYCDQNKDEPSCLKAAAVLANPDSIVDIADNAGLSNPAVAATSIILQLQLKYSPQPPKEK